jgi:hypothetical protein
MWLIKILVLVRCQGIYYGEGGFVMEQEALDRSVSYQFCSFPSIIFPPMKGTRRKSCTVLCTSSLELTASLNKPLK